MVVAVKKKRILGYSPWAYPGMQPFQHIFETPQNCKLSGFEGIDAFLLSGGTDIHPGYYNEEAQRWNQAGAQPSDRDVFEWKSILYCKKHKIPIIGICRGAQMLCAAAGGSLIQHVTGHGYDHKMVTSDGQVMFTTSVHHQMMNPYKIEHKMLAWTEHRRSNTYLNGAEEEVVEMKEHEEPEIVYFPEVHGLGIQGHPEYGHAPSNFVQYCTGLVEEYLLK
jgi:gamma-glutamyl-gamma-aminobutyrate hydrolase PuuD